jgi:DNA-binding response OmpR family regulator
MSTPTRPADTLTVLIVEDNPDQAESLALCLSLEEGVWVEVAPDGESAIASARRNPPDAVICDITLPGMDGFAVAEELRRVLPEKPLLIALTGSAGLDDRLFKAGFDKYYRKPTDPLHILITLRLHQARRRAMSGGPSPPPAEES